jgi:hypothetical protein
MATLYDALIGLASPVCLHCSSTALERFQRLLNFDRAQLGEYAAPRSHQELPQIAGPSPDPLARCEQQP